MRPPRPQRQLVILVVLATVAIAVAAGLWRHARAATSASTSSWLVLASNRDGGEYTLGEGQTYAMRPSGSRLTSLLGTESRLTPVAVSANGRAVAYQNANTMGAVYVSRSDGTGLARVLAPNQEQLGDVELTPDGGNVAITRVTGPDEHPMLVVVDADGRHPHRLGRAASPDWSADGKLLVFATQKGCALAAAPFAKSQARIRGACGYPEFSPDGQFVAFQTKSRCAVVRTPALSLLERVARGPEVDSRVLLAGTCAGPAWSPDGRWIAYQSPGCPYCDSEKARRAALRQLGIWVVRPDGSGRRRVGPANEEEGADYSWSPDGKRLAITTGSKLVIVTPDGRRTRVRGLKPYAAPLWSPDGRRLTLAAQTGDDPTQIWSLRPDGTDLRRLTSAGVNDLIGVVRGAPTRPPTSSLPPSERVLGPRLLGTARPIGRLAADGSSVAYVAGSTKVDCEHVSVWTPGAGTIRRIWPRLSAPCYDDYTAESSVYELALAGSMVGWSLNLGCGNSGCGVETHTAKLPKADPTLVDFDDGADYGNEFLRPFYPVGRGNVFAVESHVRVALPGGNVRRCALPGHHDAESVDGRRLAVRTERGEVVVDDRCAVVSTIPLAPKGLMAVLLDGARLVVVRQGLLEAYDVTGGGLVVQRPRPAGSVVDGAANGLVVLHRGTTVTALRLDDGRSVSFRPCHGPVAAAIGARGLYYTYTTPEREGRLVLVPRQELERRLTAGSSYEPRCLRSAERLTTGRGPTSVAVGDLNRDGRPDLATANESGSISVLLRGSHAFESRRDYRAGGSANDVAVADVDGDGAPDVVAVLGEAKAVSILRNRGDGSFGPPRRYRTAQDPVAVAVGDLNADGALDLAVASGTADFVSVLLNRGDGTFAHKTDRAVGSSPSALVIADVTGDGRADLVLGHGGEATATVLVGAGDGTFPHARGYATEEEANAIAVADLNGNGRPDLAVVRGCSVSVLLDQVGGGFGAPRELPHSEDCQKRVATGDLDGDGRPDLVTSATSYGFPISVSVFLNRGHGRFGAAGTYQAGGNSTNDGDLVVHDLDGDGKLDIAVANYDGNFVAVLTNTLGVCRVRGFRGTTLPAARALLARAGCRVGGVRRAYAKRVPRGKVVAAEPRFGAFWPTGPEVDLVVSLGAKG